MWQRQPLHLLLAALVCGLTAVAWPQATPLFWGTVAVALLHHAWVALWWRSELHGKRVTGRFGYPLGFRIYAVGFAIIALCRISVVWLLAWKEPGDLGVPQALQAPVAGASLLLFATLMASVKLTFGMQRAFGLDHWEPQRCIDMGFVRRGLHRLTPNAMYTFAPSVLLVSVFWWDSRSALVASLANWALLWVHYYCTEKPDMARIYGASASP